jgi:fumarate hydratase class II
VSLLTASSTFKLGLSEIYIKAEPSSLLMMGVLKPTEAEAQEMAAAAQNAQPDPQAQYLQAASEEAIARASKAQADSILAVARAEEARAKTTETLSKVSTTDQDRIFALADRLTQPAQPMQ